MSYPKPPTCKGCPAYTIGTSFVPAVGPTDPLAIIIGQGPGRDEAQFGTPFIGPSGAKLDRWIMRATPWLRRDLYVTNTVWCWLPKDRPPTTREVAFCRHAHWGAPLAQRLARRTLDDGTSAVLLIPIGSAATKAVLGPHTGEQWFGSLELTEWSNDE